MAFQTFENDKNNRGQIKRKNLKIEIRSTWLGLKDALCNPELPLELLHVVLKPMLERHGLIPIMN